MMLSHKIIEELRCCSIWATLLNLWKILQVKGVLIRICLLIHSLSGTDQRYASLSACLCTLFYSQVNQYSSTSPIFVNWLLSLTRSLLIADLSQDSIIALLRCWLVLHMHSQESLLHCHVLTLSSIHPPDPRHEICPLISLFPGVHP